MEDSQEQSDASNEMEVENKTSNKDMEVEIKAPERKNFENLPWVITFSSNCNLFYCSVIEILLIFVAYSVFFQIFQLSFNNNIS